MATRKFTLTANGAAVPASGNASFNCNGRATFNIAGTFGGGTVIIQAKHSRDHLNALTSDSSYSKVNGSSDYTISAFDSIESARNVEYRFFLSGATAPNIEILVETDQ